MNASTPIPTSARKAPFKFMAAQAFTGFLLLAAMLAFIIFPFQSDAWRANYLLPYLIGLEYLMVGIWMFAVRRREVAGRSLALFLAGAAVTAGSVSTRTNPFILFSGMLLAGAALSQFALNFPTRDPWLKKIPWVTTGLYIGAGILALLSLILTWGDINAPLHIGTGLTLAALGYSYGLIAAGFLLLGLRRLKNGSPIEREEVRIIFWAGVVSFAPLGGWLAGSLLGVNFGLLTGLVILLAAVFPISVIYTFQRYQMRRSDLQISRAVVYVILAVLISVGYALFVAGLGVLLGSMTGITTIVAGFVMFVLALALNPVRQSLQNMVDVVFFRGERAYQDRLQTFSGELTNVVEVTRIIKTLRSYVDKTLMPGNFHIFVYDPLSDQYAASPGPGGRPTSELRFTPNPDLARYLNERHAPMTMEDLDSRANEFKIDQLRFKVLGMKLLVPLTGRQRLNGWLAMGDRMSGEPFTNRDLAFLEALSDQAAMALERAQVVVNMENRVREMNVLTRVAQGINVTLELNDILELIYAQTVQVIPADDFHLMLTEGDAQTLMELFCVEANERFSEYENKPVRGQTLEQEVVRQRRAMMTDEYMRECQRAGILVTRSNLFAWMGVPLNAGAQVIGTLSLAKRDMNVTYSREQLNLFQAIADQAAGAIVKARLLEESEKRARQLTVLNRVTRQLTATLELKPLLDQVLENAVGIINGEGGGLYIVDRLTGKLDLQSVLGGQVIQQYFASPNDLVQKALDDRKALLENTPPALFSNNLKSDEDQPYTPRTCLVSPLLVQEDVLGMIVVVNRLDGQPFEPDDLDLLTAYSNQASVALDNARLYTMTDQALAARVEELSVMQRVDRELNTSLDTNRTMQITLEWALRQSGASAGFIGVVQEEGLQVKESSGYGDEISIYQDALMPFDLFGMEQVIENGQMVVHIGADGRRLKPGALDQAVIPIRRETTTMGVLVLESSTANTFGDDHAAFLTRLTDHAAIAISNAQLYAAVQAANIAKSEFVSFVSHELKNPMTSIKGYTELLAAGAVGPITDAQANFLATIRSNVERMATLVSDLADVSRIEAGRLRLDFKSIATKDALEEVVRSLRRQMDDKKQRLNLEIPDGLPNVWADRTRLVQIITNLVSNAVKYTPAEGEIQAAAEVCENRWDETGARQVVHIWVKDNGIGISEEDQKKIFQKFFRSEDPKTRESPGTGLGLNITRSLVEFQGGKIWFESEFRHGTTFHFTVPVAE